jgi:hypothetical protein
MATEHDDEQWRCVYKVNDPSQSTKLTLKGTTKAPTKEGAQQAALIAAKQWIDATV